MSKVSDVFGGIGWGQSARRWTLTQWAQFIYACTEGRAQWHGKEIHFG